MTFRQSLHHVVANLQNRDIVGSIADDVEDDQSVDEEVVELMELV